MNYTATADIYKVLSKQEATQLTRDDPHSESPDTTTVDDALNRAEGVVDSYLKVKYLVPLDNAPTEVVNAVLSLARYYLKQRRGFIEESIQADFDATMRWLRDISKGFAEIDAEAGGTISIQERVKTGFANKDNVAFYTGD